MKGNVTITSDLVFSKRQGCKFFTYRTHLSTIRSERVSGKNPDYFIEFCSQQTLEKFAHKPPVLPKPYLPLRKRNNKKCPIVSPLKKLSPSPCSIPTIKTESCKQNKKKSREDNEKEKDP